MKLAPSSVRPFSARDAARIQLRDAQSQRKAEQDYNSDEGSWRRSGGHGDGANVALAHTDACNCQPTQPALGYSAHDTEAKMNARDMVSQVEACFSEKRDYTRCKNGAGTLPIGTGVGRVSADVPNATTYTVTAVSKDRSGGENHRFVISRTGPSGFLKRSCAPSGEGGCSSSGTW